MSPWLQDKTASPFPIRQPEAGDSAWLPLDEGELSVDVHDSPEAIVIKSPIAGVAPEDLDLSLHHDMLTIRGKRTEDLEQSGRSTILHRECHWGPFSRSIILPCSVRADEATAKLANGILTIRLPKATRSGVISIDTDR